MSRTKRKRKRKSALGFIPLWIAVLTVLSLWMGKAYLPAAFLELLPWWEPSVEYGRTASTSLDGIELADPFTKNNKDLVVFVTEAWQREWGYVWGTCGNVLTDSLLADKLAQYPDHVKQYEDYIRENWVGHRTADCVGLIKAYAWFDPTRNAIRYAGGTMPDISTEQLFAAATEKGSVKSIPEIPGLIVYAPGHVGVYIGDGYVIEAMGTKAGVVRTKLRERTFTWWLKCPYFIYDE